MGRAVVFANGVRERMLSESGGSEVLSELFETFVDVSPFAKPWEWKSRYDDRVAGEHVLRLDTAEDARIFFDKRAFDYVLVVGLEWSEQRRALVDAVSGSDWGILFVRGDMRDLSNGRRYDTQGILGLRQRLRHWQRRKKTTAKPPRHLFTNELGAFDFPEVTPQTDIIPVNHNDADSLYKAVAIDGPQVIAFLDQAVTHTFADNDSVAEERFFDTQKAAAYHAAVNACLSDLSNKTGHPVAVCLHPNAPSAYAEAFDPAFRIVRGDTPGVLQNAALALTHNSMTTGFCHLLSVPTLLLDLGRDLTPKRLGILTRRKARNEGLQILQWPGPLPDTVRRAGDARVRQFLRPVPDSEDLAAVLRKHLID